MLGNKNYVRLFTSIPLKLFDWWEIDNKVNLNYNDFYLPRISIQHYNGFGLGIESYHSLYLPADIDLSIDINFNSENTFIDIKNRDTFSLNLELTIPVFKNGRFNIFLKDVFNTLESGYQYDFNNVSFNTNSKYNTRALTVGFNYYFSKGKEIDEYYKESGIEPEKENIKN